MTLWMVFAVMLVVALLFLLPPLLKPPRASGPGQNEINIVLHRKRLMELEGDLANGVLNETQFAQARDDLERELLQELIAPNAIAPVPTPSPSRVSAVFIAIAVPVLALGLYYQLGDWRRLGATPPPSAADAAAIDPAASGAMPSGMPSIPEMIKRLESKLATDPNNAQGWLMLGRSYVYTNRYADAVRAYAQAEALTDPPDAQLYAEYAEALALANGDKLAGAPERLVTKALKLQPDNPNALWLAGMIAFQKSDYPGAVKFWAPLQKVTPPDSEQGRILQDYLAQARAGKPNASLPADNAAAETNAAGKPAAPAATGPVALHVHVALDSALAGKASPDATVFIFARAVRGPPMPLAIVRKQVKDLPVDVTLDDSQAMMPAMKLSNFTDVIVGARISKTGNALPASGDLQALSGSTATHTTTPIGITINQVVP
ncbi:MAG: c-type cytochrome biogenesis protein CcmI [Gammaproteobacteria bacterium]